MTPRWGFTNKAASHKRTSRGKRRPRPAGLLLDPPTIARQYFRPNLLSVNVALSTFLTRPLVTTN